MTNPDYARQMARYNNWQNDNLLEAADTLSEADRQLDRGAFFGSIQRTFSHLLWGDSIWFSRFAGTPAPQTAITDSADFITGWSDFRTQRKDLDRLIIKWADSVSPEWFTEDLSWYSGAIGQHITRPNTTLVVQFFNHQTHHRGQIHAILTAAGTRPSDTDVPFMPEAYAKL